MSNSIPIVFRTNAMQSSSLGYVGQAGIYVNPPETVRDATYYTDFKVANNNWAVILDRKDPTKPALFNARLDSNTQPPPDLANLMTPDSILFFMSAGYSGQIPQGALFTMLQENGGGAQLQKLERLAYYSGCGLHWFGLYTLVSVPGSGLPGIENSEPGQIAYSGGPSSVRSTVTLSFNTLLEMIPGPSGYMPVEIG